MGRDLYKTLGEIIVYSVLLGLALVLMSFINCIMFNLSFNLFLQNILWEIIFVMMFLFVYLFIINMYWD